jgi:hypothetical protein
LASKCKPCVRENENAFYQAHKEDRNAKSRERYFSNKEKGVAYGKEPSATKICSKCGEEYPATTEFFHRRTANRDGFSSKCKVCAKAYDDAYRSLHADESRAATKEWHWANKEYANQLSRDYYATHKQEAKAYAEANKDRLIVYRQGRKKQAALLGRKWREENRDRVNANARKRREDARNRVAFNIRNQISSALRGSKNGRHWEDLVGFTLDDLIVHLQSKFLSGMSLDNYGRGGWHVDHIIPVAAFDFSSPDDAQFKECFTLSNLQPLWEEDNASKSDKIEINGEIVYARTLRRKPRHHSEGSESWLA